MNISNDNLLTIIFCFILNIIFVMPFLKKFPKAGYNQFLAFLAIIPGFNIIMLYYLPFAEWPVLKDKK